MALSLKDTIKSSSGVYQDSSSASDALGRTANPTNPLAASTLGLNPDQAKMAGTAANKTSAQRDLTAGAANPEGVPSLRDAIRKEQPNAQLSEGDAQKKAAVANLMPWEGKLENRVQAIASQYANGVKPTIPLPKVDAGHIDAAGIVPASGSSADLANNINSLFDPNATAESKTTAGNAVAQALNLKADDPNFLTTLHNRISSIMPNADADIAKSVAGAISDYDKVTLGVLFKEDPQGAAGVLGSMNDLGRVLGMTPDDVSNLNLPALKQKLDEIGAKDFGYIKDLQRRAADPYTSEAERTAVLHELKSLGASGVRATEQDYSKFNDTVKQGQMVNVGGQSMTLEAALSDDRISAQVTAYLKMTPEQQADFAASNPDLAKLINSNKQVLTDASKRLDDATKAAADAVVAQKKTIGSVQLSDGAMKALMPDYGKYGATMPPESQAFLDKMKDMPAPVANFINDQLTSGAVTAKDLPLLSNLPPEVISGLSTQPSALRSYLDYTSMLESRRAQYPGWGPLIDEQETDLKEAAAHPGTDLNQKLKSIGSRDYLQSSLPDYSIHSPISGNIDTSNIKISGIPTIPSLNAGLGGGVATPAVNTGNSPDAVGTNNPANTSFSGFGGLGGFGLRSSLKKTVQANKGKTNAV